MKSLIRQTILILTIILLINCNSQKKTILYKNSNKHIDSLFHLISIDSNNCKNLNTFLDPSKYIIINNFFEIAKFKEIDSLYYEKILTDTSLNCLKEFHSKSHRQFIIYTYKNELYCNIIYTFCSNENYKYIETRKNLWNKYPIFYTPYFEDNTIFYKFFVNYSFKTKLFETNIFCKINCKY